MTSASAPMIRNTPPSAEAALRARVIVERQPDGTLILEQYTNGARTREILFPGLELTMIRDALYEQEKHNNNAAERKAIAAAKKEEALHKRVWHNVAYGIDGKRGQGEAFANRFVHPPAHEGTAIADLQRVCHCGQVEPVFWTNRCAGCKGPSGAGKILKGEKGIKRLSEEAKDARRLKPSLALLEE